MHKKQNSIQTIALEFIEQRNNKSFSILIDRLKPGLISYIYKYIQNNDLINEVLSLTFTTIWEKIEQYNVEKGNFSTWIYRIARNEALGIIRRGNKIFSHEKMTENHSKILKIYTPFNNFQTEVIGPTGEELIQQLYDASLNAINNLKEPYKTVMIEREVNRKQLQTIADELGWNTSTVKTRLRKARKDIKENIKKNYPDLVTAYNEED
jgi:RNA polymerase sigma-70 factor (ECF subfamily)